MKTTNRILPISESHFANIVEDLTDEDKSKLELSFVYTITQHGLGFAMHESFRVYNDVCACCGHHKPQIAESIERVK